MREVVVVGDTIKIPNSDGAFDVTDRSVNAAFLQETRRKSERSRRGKARSVLEKLSRADPKVALVVAAVGLDTFDKVKTEIDKIVVELGKQQADEVAQRYCCAKEIVAHDLGISVAVDKQTSPQTEISDVSKTVDLL